MHPGEPSRGARSRRLVLGFALAGLAAVLPITPGRAQAAVLRPGFETLELARNDDGSTGAVDIGFPANLFGTEYLDVYVNNNGNITFDSALSTFTPFSLTSTARVIVAPFFADVDTRATTNGAQPTRYGQGTVGTRPAFGATWRNVGYYSQHTEHLNTFQVVLIDRSDTGGGNFDIEFNYEAITWETGTASGGDKNGRGGSSARVGYSKGTGEANTFFEFPGSGVPGSFLGGGLTGTSRNSGVNGRHVFSVRNGAVTDTDTDGDGLLDTWEENGFDADGDGTIDVNLPAMGAKKDHKDIFVEVDHMVRPPVCVWQLCWGGRSFAPMVEALDDVRAAFALGDIRNPDGTTGINMHIDAGATTVMNSPTNSTWGALSGANEVPYAQRLGTRNADRSYNWTAFDARKAAHFNASRAKIFHYAIYGEFFADSLSSGISNGIPGAAFLVTDGDWANGFSRTEEAGTFMHELGHNLGLSHGGGDGVQYKPNYLSVMNYSFQFTGIPNAFTLDYSRRKLRPLNESRLDERAGLDPDAALVGLGTVFYCPGGAKRSDGAPATNVDWNCNGSGSQPAVAANINRGAGTTLTGYDDWANIVFDGGPVGPGSAPAAAPAGAAVEEEELTFDTAVERGVAAAPGDGGITFEGPTSLIPDTGTVPLVVTVQNLSSISTRYRVRLTSPLVGTVEQTISLAGGFVGTVSFPVSTAGVAPGTQQMIAELFVDGESSLRASELSSVDIIDMNAAGATEDLADALVQLGTTTDPELSPAVAGAFATMGNDELGAPTATMTRPGTQRFLLDTPTRITWIAPSDPDGIAGYDVTRRSATPKGAFGDFTTVAANTTTTTMTSQLAPGTHCWRARATDGAGTVGAFSGDACVGIPIPIASGAARGTWRSVSEDAAYRGVLLSSTQKGASVTFSGLRFRTLSVIASRSMDAGKVAVIVAGERIATINLRGRAGHAKSILIRAGADLVGPVTVKLVVVSKGKPVQLEGLGVSRV